MNNEKVCVKCGEFSERRLSMFCKCGGGYKATFDLESVMFLLMTLKNEKNISVVKEYARQFEK